MASYAVYEESGYPDYRENRRIYRAAPVLPSPYNKVKKNLHLRQQYIIL
jgi:hypothetical protein